MLARKFDARQPSKKHVGDGPPVVIGKEEVERFKEESFGVQKVISSCLNDDFNHYTIGCLSPWYHYMNKPEIGAWIATRVLNDFGYRESNCAQYDEDVASGGGRGKPVWSERIGKKYQWIAMYELASRLYDTVEAREEGSVRTTQVTPLVLQEERKLDPTIEIIDRAKSERSGLPGSCNLDFEGTKSMPLAGWVKKRDDIPRLSDVISSVKDLGPNWIPLTLFPSWSDRPPTETVSKPYRNAWMHLRGYIVSNDGFSEAVRVLDGIDFFGRWMPEGAKWLHLFLGEYPWATASNHETDEWLGYTDKLSKTNLRLIPVSNEVVAEWEYDASLRRSIYYQVPARKFFEGVDLSWNGVDGFETTRGTTVFRQLLSTEDGLSGLLVDSAFLSECLNRLNCRLIWTLLGEKQILGMDNKIPSQSYSQVAYLTEKGRVEVRKRHFEFDRVDKNLT